MRVDCRSVTGGLRGFTLVEVVLVMVLITMMAAIAVPRYANALARYRVDLAAARVVADLALAQRQARFASTAQTVEFDTSTETYQLPGLPDPDRPANDYQVKLSDEPYVADIVSVDLGGDAKIVFNGFGLPDGGGTIVLQVGGYGKTVIVDADSGQAQTQ